jgi:hypothetical protein
VSLDAVQAVLRHSLLNTRNVSLQTHSPELYAAITRKAQLFLRLLAEVPISGGDFTFEELSAREWGDVERSFFWSLDTDVQLEVLGALTVGVHEWVHYLDLLATPFGVNLTIKHAQEFILFQELAPFLLTHPDKTLAEPLADWLTKTSELGWLLSHQNEDPHSFDALRQGVWGKMAFDDYVTGSVPRRVTPGWGGVMLEIDGYVGVTVNGVWPALRRVSDPTNYIGPFELLEGRALTMCLRYLRHCLGDSTDATELVRKYVGTFYPSQPRYTRILELLAGESLDSALSNPASAKVDSLLLYAQALTWYALHAPPPLQVDDIIAAMPTARFQVGVVALQEFQDHGVVFPSVAAMLDNIDQSELAKKAAFGTSNDLLVRTVNASGLTALSLQSVSNRQSMVDCYMTLLGAQGLIVQARVGQGYASGYGYPDDGNPMKAGDEALGQALKALKPLHGELNEWVQSRNRIFLGFATPQQRVDEVRKWSC